MAQYPSFSQTPASRGGSSKRAEGYRSRSDYESRSPRAQPGYQSSGESAGGQRRVAYGAGSSASPSRSQRSPPSRAPVRGYRSRAGNEARSPRAAQQGRQGEPYAGRGSEQLASEYERAVQAETLRRFPEGYGDIPAPSLEQPRDMQPFQAPRTDYGAGYGGSLGIQPAFNPGQQQLPPWLMDAIYPRYGGGGNPYDY